METTLMCRVPRQQLVMSRVTDDHPRSLLQFLTAAHMVSSTGCHTRGRDQPVGLLGYYW